MKDGRRILFAVCPFRKVPGRTFFSKVLLSPRAAGYGCLGPQSSPPAGVRYHAPTSAAARVARPVMHQLIHPDSFKPHYEQSRVVASLSVATGLYHFVSMALPSRVLSFAPSIMGLNIAKARTERREPLLDELVGRVSLCKLLYGMFEPRQSS